MPFQKEINLLAEPKRDTNKPTKEIKQKRHDEYSPGSYTHTSLHRI